MGEKKRGQEFCQTKSFFCKLVNKSEPCIAHICMPGVNNKQQQRIHESRIAMILY